MPEKKAFLLRISADLWAEVQTIAAEELRSVNSQMEVLLREAISRRRRGEGTGNTGAGTATAGGASRRSDPSDAADATVEIG